MALRSSARWIVVLVLAASAPLGGRQQPLEGLLVR